MFWNTIITLELDESSLAQCSIRVFTSSMCIQGDVKNKCKIPTLTVKWDMKTQINAKVIIICLNHKKICNFPFHYIHKYMYVTHWYMYA